MLVPIWIINIFGLYMLTSLIASVWWASNIATTLNFMKEAMDKMENHISSSDSVYSTKVEAAKDMAVLTKSVDAAWLRIDSMDKILNAVKVELFAAIQEHKVNCNKTK